MRWYAVFTKSRMELWARTNLWDRGLEVYLPRYRKRRRHARRVDVVSMPLFPRYLFVRADLKFTGRRIIHSTPGAVGLVTFGDIPAAVSDDVIGAIRSREDADGFVRLADPCGLKRGERVNLVDGPLSDFDALFNGETKQGRVIVLLSLLGRDVQAEVPPGWIGINS